MFLLSLFFPVIVSSKLTYKQLIFGNGSYDKEESPYDVTGEFMAIYLQPTYFILVNVEENQQLVSFLGCLNYTWKDPRLAYDPKVVGSDSVIIPTSLIWLPWVYCYNCVEVTFLAKATPSDDASVLPDGTVTTIVRARFDTICTCDICKNFLLCVPIFVFPAAFPFDTQFCGLNLDGGLSSFDQMNYVPVEDPSLQTTLGTPEWNIEYYNNTNDPVFISMRIIYKLKRNSQFYFYFMILPTLVITSTCLAALLLPSNLSYGEKITMGVTGLLGLTFLLSILVQEVPRSNNLPLIGKWLLIEMFTCIVAMGIISPMEKLKLRYCEKKPLWALIADVAAFLVVFGVNGLTTLFMLLFPGDLKEAPNKPF